MSIQDVSPIEAADFGRDIADDKVPMLSAICGGLPVLPASPSHAARAILVRNSCVRLMGAVQGTYVPQAADW